MKVAVIGCGSIGGRYLNWARELGNDVAVCDTSANIRRKIERDGNAAVFSSMSDVLDWSPDRVIVSTPPIQHEIMSLPIIEAGLPLLIEKPIAHDCDSARNIVVAADSGKAPAWVVCNMRFHKGIQTIKSCLDMVGRPLTFRAVFGHRLSQMRTTGGDFARDSNTGGGVVLDCIHEFDYLRWLFGPISAIKSCVEQVGDDALKAEDLAQVILTFESGLRGSLHLDFLMRQKRRGLEVIGTEGNLIWLSTGRMPENCEVSFATQCGEKQLLDVPDLDASLAYRNMLDRFFGDGEGLQTVDDAMAALQAALTARGAT